MKKWNMIGLGVLHALTLFTPFLSGALTYTSPISSFCLGIVAILFEWPWFARIPRRCRMRPSDERARFTDGHGRRGHLASVQRHRARTFHRCSAQVSV